MGSYGNVYGSEAFALWCVAFGCLFAAICWWIGAYNELVNRKNACRRAFEDLQAQLRLRYDLVPQLVSCVKGYAKHEYKTLKDVTSARTLGLKAANDPDILKADSKMTCSVKNLWALAEQYPKLKADKTFTMLMGELGYAEIYIQQARSEYNAAVNWYNDSVMNFPSSMVAKRHGFCVMTKSSIPDEDRRKMQRPPKISFDDCD